MSETLSPKPAMDTQDRASPERSASPKAAVEEGQQDALAGMFDDFPAQPPVAAGSPARSTTDSPVKRKRSLSETSSRSSRSRIGSDDDDDETKSRNRMEYADEENVGMVEVLQAISSVVLPKFPKLASSDGQVWALRLPSAISFPGEPFHPDLYRSEQGPVQEEEDAEDDTEQKRKTRALKRMHAVTNTVRWKWVSGTHGETVKRSNSRVIRWSDGTASLMIGQEMWDLQTDGVTSGSTAADKASIKPFALGNEVNQESQSQVKPEVQGDNTAKRPAREGPVSLLLATDFDNSVLVSDSLVTGTLSLVPLTRNVRDHPKRVGAIEKSTFKASKILHYHDTSGIRPDKQIEDKVKEMQEQQKKRMKARGHDVNAGLSLPVWKGSGGGGGGGARADRGDREGSPLGAGTSGGGKKRGGGKRRRTSYSSDEDMDGDGGRGAGGYGGGDYESDDFVVDDDEDEDLGRGNRSESEVSQAESNGLSALDRDLNRAADEETRRRREDKKSKKSKRDKKSSRDYDSDEDGDDDGDFGAKRPKARESDDEEIDMLEKAAERASQAEKKEKKDRKRREQEASNKNDSIDADDLLDDGKDTGAMDVDDEDIQIDGSQVIRKRVLQYDDEDDE